MKKVSKRWVFLVLFSFFLFIQEFNRLFLSQMTPELTGLFHSSGIGFLGRIPWTAVVAAVAFLLWGYLFDSYQRRKLFTIVGFLWWMTSWLTGIAPTFSTFELSITAAAIPQSSSPGIFSLVGDFFKPNDRGKILGLLLISQPLALFFSTLLMPGLLNLINWRFLTLFLGGFGIIFGLVAYRFFHSPLRGDKEPALMDIPRIGRYLFDWSSAKVHLKQTSMIVIYLLGFFSIIPWISMTSWAVEFLTTSANNPDLAINFQDYILPGLTSLTLSFPLAGFLGDFVFQKMKSGRILVSMASTAISIISLILIFIARNTSGLLLLISLVGLGLSFSFLWPNIIASIMDITLPELRGSASGVYLFFQTIGAVLSPIFVSLLKDRIGLIGSITWVSVTAWIACLILLIILYRRIPDDIEQLRKHMAYRSYLEMQLKNASVRER